jgi:phosphoribosylanthranilate isomerase
VNRVRVKVCGITNKEDLKAAVDAGVDALGFVVDVPESPRNVSVDRAQNLVEAIPPFVQCVVVSVFKSREHLKALCSSVAPDAVQIAGTLPAADAVCGSLRGIQVIRTIAVNERTVPETALRSAAYCDAVLTDSSLPGVYGGTGIPHNWAISRAIKDLIAPTPLILAGGLTAANVQTAIKIVRPYAVDVSSGVEARPGVKDYAKLRAFMEAVKEAHDGL